MRSSKVGPYKPSWGKAKNAYRAIVVTFQKPDEKPLKPRRNLFSYGPEVLGLGLKTIQTKQGPGEPPPGFVGGTTSRSEWWVYWALTKLLGPEGEAWTYQQSYQGGRHIPGGSVVDFVVYMPLQTILIRLQTYRFHFALGNAKQSRDIEQKFALSDEQDSIVVDIYEQDFIGDESGRAVLMIVNEAINGIERSNPLATGLVFDHG